MRETRNFFLPLVVEILGDDVPGAVVRQQRVRVQRPLGERVARDRVVGNLDRPLLRDRALELCEAARHLRRVVGIEHLHADGGLGRLLAETRPAEGEVLQREPQRLGVGELAVEEEERGLQRRELVVAELQLGQEVLLRAQRVELLAGELVAVRVQRNAQRDQLRAIRVEAAREGLVRHLRVALDVRLHVARGQRAALRHEEGDERELADQLVGVVTHSSSVPRRPVDRAVALSVDYVSKKARLSRADVHVSGATGPGYLNVRSSSRKVRSTLRDYYAATRVSRCWCDGQ